MHKIFHLPFKIFNEKKTHKSNWYNVSIALTNQHKHRSTINNNYHHAHIAINFRSFVSSIDNFSSSSAGLHMTHVYATKNSLNELGNCINMEIFNHKHNIFHKFLYKYSSHMKLSPSYALFWIFIRTYE